MSASKTSGSLGICQPSRSLCRLGENIPTQVGHQASDFYAATFLAGSLGEMGIHTVADLQARFRERKGLLGSLSDDILVCRRSPYRRNQPSSLMLEPLL